jgi:thiol-disulfide isomerase/thioredoxin
MRRPVLYVLGAAALVAVLVIGLSQSGGESAPKQSGLTLQQLKARVKGAPAPLAALHARASQLLPGSKSSVRRELAALKGYPVVLNKWASWCAPCRAEFPVLQDASVRWGKRVAFVGLNSGDNDASARRFLRKHPVAYPSFTDGNARIALDQHAGTNYPTTVFIDRDGHRYVHQGPYYSRADFDADLRRYALS